ncbi:MAG: post-COAP-1 domain-containing protein [Thermoleophilaceae bacterium]
MNVARSLRSPLLPMLLALFLVGSPAAAQAQAPGTMTNEHFLAAAVGPAAIPGHTHVVSGTCNEGDSQFTFTASGQADGAYFGTFTESGSFTLSPITAGSRRDMTSFESTFRIDAAGGFTITGTKRLTPESGAQDPLGPPRGSCFDPAELGFFGAEYRGFVEWEATISGPLGNSTEEGIALVDGQDIRPGSLIPLGRSTFVEAFPIATRTDEPRQPATLTLDPKAATNEVGTTHCVTATVRDAQGDPFEGVTVRFDVAGSVSRSGSAMTDGSGQARFCYTGPDFPGTDAIRAYADSDGDGSEDPGEPSDTAQKTWILPASTPGCEVEGIGTLSTNRRAGFALKASFESGDPQPKGDVIFVDWPAELTFRSTAIDAMVVSGSRATLFGRGTANGEPVRFRVVAADLSESGGEDTFEILLSSGYLAAGSVRDGDVEVECGDDDDDDSDDDHDDD